MDPQPLQDEDPDLAEALRSRQAAIDAGTGVIRDHLHEFLARNPGGSYEAWIADLHPENVELDPRLRNRGNPWLVVWGEASSFAKAKEIRCLHGGLTLFSAIWVCICIYMHSSSHGYRNVFMNIATFLSFVLYMIQAGIWVSAFYRIRHDAWPLQVYSVGVVQILLQTGVTIMGLTSFLFHEHGLSISTCLRETRCVTTLTGRGFENDATMWKNIDNKQMCGGPFSSVDISVARRGVSGEQFPIEHVISTNGTVWDCISIKAAVPLEASYTQADKGIVCLAIIVYAIAVANTFWYIRTYSLMGEPRQRIPGWLSLKHMESIACALCSLLILLNLWAFALHPNAIFIAPAFIGILLLVALGSDLAATLSRREPVLGPFSQWQKRSVTSHGVGVMVALTYMVGLSNSILLCSGANIWPSGLKRDRIHVFFCACFVHLLLSVGYVTSLWVHLRLARLKSASQAVVPSSPTLSSSPTPAERLPRTSGPPPSTGQAGPSRGASVPGTQEDAECTVCKDELRDTVLVPCGHFAFCNGCARNVMTSRRPLCPICWTGVDDVCRVYHTQFPDLSRKAAVRSITT